MQTINARYKKRMGYPDHAEHIIKWNSASEEWHTPHATNDLRTDGHLLIRYEGQPGTILLAHSITLKN